jgi:Flp pilus assembly pilin Flp
MVLGLYTRLRVMWLGFRSHFENEDGAVATEYALLLVLVAIAIIAGATALGLAINARLQSGADTIGP